MLLCLCLSLLSVSLSHGLNDDHPLYPFLNHYEHIDYDEHDLLHHHYRVQRSMYGPREIELKFTAFDRLFDIRLYPDDSYIHKDVKIKLNSVPYKGHTSFRSLLYSGYDINDPSTQVTGHLAFDTFDGAIYTNDEIYFIEPSTRYFPNSDSPTHSIIYRHSDLNATLLNIHGRTPCGATTFSQQRNLYSIQDAGPSDHINLHTRQSGARNTSLVRCTLRVEADYKFVTNVASGSDDTTRMNSAIAVLRNLITTGSIIFQNTDFNMDAAGARDNIHFLVLEFDINTQPPPSGSFQANEFIGVEAFLNSYSEADFTAFCLSYLFTYRDFDGGVLGLAFVGNSNNQFDRCFLTEGDNCRNLLIDEGEECDCGLNFNQITGLCYNDSCCNGSICQLAVRNEASVDCSPQQGSCCLQNCSFRTLESNFTCFLEDDCAFNQTCNGTSAACPTPEPIPSENNTAIPCNGGSNYCQNGECTGSICVPLNLRDCECTQQDLKCHVCCELNEVCTSTISLAESNDTARGYLPNGEGQFLQVGFPCNNFNGYCDFLNSCQPVQSEGALRRLTNLLTGEQLESIIRYLTEYWWAALVGSVVTLVVLFLVVLACHCLLPRPEHMKKRGERRKSLRRSYSQRRRSRRAVRNSDEYPMSGYHQPATAMQYGY
uniref:Disintegrin domain-containing protein n=1 Tax=Amphimedon queenslandica TaxID=400682 RepID=A0A1X7U7R3_AMPQE